MWLEKASSGNPVTTRFYSCLHSDDLIQGHTRTFHKQDLAPSMFHASPRGSNRIRICFNDEYLGPVCILIRSNFFYVLHVLLLDSSSYEMIIYSFSSLIKFLCHLLKYFLTRRMCIKFWYIINNYDVYFWSLYVHYRLYVILKELFLGVFERKSS